MGGVDINTIFTFILNFVTLAIILVKVIKSNSGQKVVAEKLENFTVIMEQMWSKDIITTNISHIMQEVSTETLSSNIYLDKKYKNILTNWAQKIESFAIDAYYTRYRKTVGSENYLRGSMGGILFEIENSLLQSIPELVKGSTGAHTIVDYLHTNSQIYQEIEILIRRLIKNGLSETDYLNLFQDFAKKFLQEGQKAFMEFHITEKI